MMTPYLVLLLALPGALAKDYSDYRLVRVAVNSQDDARNIYAIGASHTADFLNVPAVNRTTELVVDTDNLKKMVAEFKVNNFPYVVSDQDVGSLIAEQKESLPREDGFRAYRPFKKLGDILSKFPRYLEIQRWMKQIVRDHPKIAQMENIGKTYDGKPTAVLKLSKGEFGEKKVVWIDGAIHGREWISATTVLYIMNQLLEEYSAGRTDLMDEYDWIFLPVANPDGYEFSHSTDRLWRKNRRPTVMGCFGVDLNRNFGIHWGVTKGSVSSQGCSLEYGGNAPFSEPETRNIRDYMEKVRGKLEIYLSFHSYSQLWLIPWGWTKFKAEDYDRMHCVATKAVIAARKVNGLDYRVGTLGDLLYAAAGGSFDWAKSIGAPFSYTVELRPTAEQVGLVVDRGFLVQPSEIIPAGKEMFAALRKMIETINTNKCR